MVMSKKGFYIGDIGCVLKRSGIYDGIWGASGNVDNLEGFEIPAGTEVLGKVLSDDLIFVVHGTAFGAGAYYDNNGFEYDVDSGAIGIVPLELCTEVDLNNAVGRVIEIPGYADMECADGIYTISIHSFDGGDNNPVEVFEIDTN